MKRLKKRIAAILAALTALSILPFSVFASGVLTDSGTCGENLTWELYQEPEGSYTLKISGSGDMYDYSDTYKNRAPWASRYSSIKSCEITGNVTSIGAYAFDSHKSLTSINIPDSVISIGDKAFGSCTSLTAVTIPDSVTSIGRWAFKNCTSLTSIILSNSVTSIGEDAFGECTSLTSINIPDSITSINNWTFKNCTSLTSVVIPDSVTSIGWWAFENCTSLTSVYIPNSVTGLGNGAFYCCTSLTSVTIPNNITSIGNKAFSECTSLTSVIIPDSVIRICEYAFYSCTSLTSVTIPESVTRIDDFAFVNCPITDYYYNGTLDQYMNLLLLSDTYWGGPGSDRSSKNHIDGKIYTIDRYDNYAYALDDNGTMMVYAKGDIDRGNLGYYLWNNFKSDIKSIVIKEGVTGLGERAFKDCTSLTSVTIPDSVTSIGNWAFENCTSLTSVYIPNSVTNFGYSPFSGCTSLTSINIPDTVRDDYLGGITSGCTGLTEINVGKKNRMYSSIDGVVFDKSGTKLRQYPAGRKGSYTLPQGVTEIDPRAFINCSSLTSIDISGVTHIETGFTGTFNYCESLRSITVSPSLKKIDASAFRDCSALTDVYFTGTEDEWWSIAIGPENDYFENATVHFISDIIKGDVDGDKAVSITDILYIKRNIAGLFVLTENQHTAADVDGDGKITITDVLMIKRAIAGLIALD